MVRRIVSASWAVGLLILGLALASPSLAREGEEIFHQGVHVVRPGDTLMTLAAQYLGDGGRWEEIWKLNPEIDNPRWIYPRQRLRIPLLGSLPRQMAQVTKVSRRVEGQPAPIPWQDAVETELYGPGDGLRTFELSSTELLFYDATRLVLTEDSLVYLGKTVIPHQQVERDQIEVVEGQADLEVEATAGPVNDVEIVLGDAVARPRRSAEGELQTRARRVEAGGAQLMVYGGDSELEAAGQAITVAEGMGSSVAPGSEPSPPEKLLDPPLPVAPTAGGEWSNADPPFSWQPLAGARSYTLEVCGDPRCGVLVARAVGVTETSWQPPALPLGQVYLRVTGVSPSGLDGYPSEPLPFRVIEDWDDDAGPVISVRFAGPQMPPRYGLNPHHIVGPGAEIGIEVVDAKSGVVESTTLLDGRPAGDEDLRAPWATGEHTLTVTAVDRAGNRSELSEGFVYDPDPPVFSWGIEGSPAIAAGLGEAHSGAELAPEHRGELRLEGARRAWDFDSDLGQVVARPRQRLRVPGSDVTLDRERGLWILAEDAICPDLARVLYDLAAAPPRLIVEAVDCVGNRSRVERALAR